MTDKRRTYKSGMNWPMYKMTNNKQ